MTRPLRVTALSLAMALLALSECSCALPAWLAAQFGPKKKVPAEFAPPKDKKILVFVDDIISPISYEPLKAELARRIGERLLANGVTKQVVSCDRLADVVAATPTFNLLSVSEVGQKLGADLVLYLQVDKFSLKDEAAKELWHGRLQVTVRMVDVDKGRLWPKDRPAGYTVDEVETPTSTSTSSTYVDQLTKLLAAQMADRVARLFYAHTATYEGAWPG